MWIRAEQECVSRFACNTNSFSDFSGSVEAFIVIDDVCIQINVSGNLSIHVHPSQTEKSSTAKIVILDWKCQTWFYFV